LPLRWVSAMRRWLDAFVAEMPTDYAPLVIQGDQDTTVDWRWNLARIRQTFPAAEIRILPGARHQLVNESPALRAQVFAALGLVRD
jgi:lysophospholipase